MKKLLFIPFIFLISSCSVKLKHELLETQMALNKAHMMIAEMQFAMESKVVHSLYFTLKEGISDEETQTFLDYLNQLGELPYVRDIRIGIPSDVPDPRAKRDYDVAMEMRFQTRDDLIAYQQDSTHLSIRSQAAPLLGGPPVVYDFEVVE